MNRCLLCWQNRNVVFPRCSDYDECRKSINPYAGNEPTPVDMTDSPFTQTGVGFLSVAYNRTGGTETFHRMLLPRLDNVAGFVSTAISGGDPALLGCRYGHGINAAKQLVAVSDVIVTWGIDSLNQILPVSRPPVVMVHHGDISSRWTHAQFLEQTGLWDLGVAVNAEVAEFLRERTGKTIYHIPNAVDHARVLPSRTKDETRKRYGLGDERVVLWGHRMSIEKHPAIAAEIAQELPDGWVMVMAGEGPIAPQASDKLRLVGRVDPMGDLFAIADAFLSCATQEGFGLSVAEAMLAGVPVFSTPLGIAKSPEHATHFSIDDSPQTIALKIVEAAEKRATVDAARSMIESQHGVVDFVERWRSVIASVEGSSTTKHQCRHQGAFVGEMECECGSVYLCIKINKYCSPKQPIDGLVHIAGTQVMLSGDSFQWCGSCVDREPPTAK